MNIYELTDAILSIRSNAEFSIDGDVITWLDDVQTEPTKAEIENAYKTLIAAKETAETAKATKKAALLEKLGITEDEAKLLLS